MAFQDEHEEPEDLDGAIVYAAWVLSTDLPDTDCLAKAIVYLHNNLMPPYPPDSPSEAYVVKLMEMLNARLAGRGR